MLAGSDMDCPAAGHPFARSRFHQAPGCCSRPGPECVAVCSAWTV